MHLVARPTPPTITGIMEDRPLWFHRRGLQETASGYGRRLRTSRVIRLTDDPTRARRLYCCIYSNSGTCYIRFRGRLWSLQTSVAGAGDTVEFQPWGEA